MLTLNTKTKVLKAFLITLEQGPLDGFKPNWPPYFPTNYKISRISPKHKP